MKRRIPNLWRIGVAILFQNCGIFQIVSFFLKFFFLSFLSVRRYEFDANYPRRRHVFNDVLAARVEEARRAKVKQQSGTTAEPDMRTGWLLWQESLRQFLYFEEEMLVPNPDEYEARWVERISKSGARKSSTNLWIFDKATGAKRYSVTTEAGAKIQPYFDVPPLTDPNVFIFTVIGEVLNTGLVQIWLTAATARELKTLLGSLDTDTLSKAVLETANRVSMLEPVEEVERETAEPFTITLEAYEALQHALPGVSDEHSFQLLAEQLRQ